jgi:hypothetical protein
MAPAVADAVVTAAIASTIAAATNAAGEYVRKLFFLLVNLVILARFHRR